ncbi:MAG TPA: hypothetical protein VFO78_11075 [Candidatus Limnocylindrales bacterium]|nr:hypothetical protein [Candidatus Limnocylindrales bacterium]
MVKRIAAPILWFFTIATAWNFVVLMSGAPSFPGLALGAVVAVFVAIDPFHLIWGQAHKAPASRQLKQATAPDALGSGI